MFSNPRIPRGPTYYSLVFFSSGDQGDLLGVLSSWQLSGVPLVLRGVLRSLLLSKLKSSCRNGKSTDFE